MSDPTPRPGRPRILAGGPAVAIGEAIRTRREAAGLSQEQLAEQAGLTARTLGDYERGRIAPRLDVAGRIADVLKCRVDALLK